MIKSIKIIEPTQEILEASIRNNIFFYYVMMFAWIGFLLYGSVMKDTILLMDAILFFIATVGFRIMQKIDSARLEILKQRKNV